MNKTHRFIEMYLAAYLSYCRIINPFIETQQTTPIPPSSKELEELMSYLLKNEMDPVILGTIAVIKHLRITDEDIKVRTFRPTTQLELFVSTNPSTPPKGWYFEKETAHPSWISPTSGRVKFVFLEDLIANNSNWESVGKDLESVVMGCPLADVKTIFKMKLNLKRRNDLGDLLHLVSRLGIPEDLDCQFLNDEEKKNLELIERWAKRLVK